MLDLARRSDVLGDEHLVELLRLDALLQRGVRLLDLLVDQRLEGLERHGAGDEPAVDEERRRAVGAHLGSVAGLGRDGGGDLRRLLVLAPASDVEPDLLRPLLVLGVRQLGLVLEEQLMHLPELALLVRRHRRLGRGQRVGVEGERLVAPDELHVAFVRLEDLLDGRLGAPAEGALEVGELDDGHLGLLRPDPGRVGPQVDTAGLRGGRRLGRRSGRARLAVLHQRFVQVLARHALRQRRVGTLER